MHNNTFSSTSFEKKPLELILTGFSAKFHPYPEDMNGNFVMRNSTDFQNAKIFAEVITGHRVLLAELQCNISAQKAINVLTEAFKPLRDLIANEKAAKEAGRDHLNHYERRQEERRDRYTELAIKNRKASGDAFNASHNAVAHIPFGQPILIGHHSEKRHRGVITRAHRLMDKCCELGKTADYYDQRAESVGKSGISSDDPEAVHKLTEKVSGLKNAHAMMIAANKIVRLKNVTEEVKQEKLFCLGYSERMIKEILVPMYGKQGFAPYQLSLSSKAIKTAESRIATINKNKELNTDEQTYKGFTVQYDKDDNRILFRFDTKPDEVVRKLLKRNAFNFSPSRSNAWVRKITPNALFATKYLIKDLEGII